MQATIVLLFSDSYANCAAIMNVAAQPMSFDIQ
jgi:hypothetical protein